MFFSSNAHRPTRKASFRKVFIASVCALVSATALPSCGLLGGKKTTSRVVTPQSDGCYNDLSKKVERFFKGEISEQEWVSTFDCVNDQLDFFKKFARPSSADGYTQGDIGALTRRFLITHQSVSDHFISALFQMKASTVGGPVDIITADELDEFLKLSDLLRRESLVLLPLIRSGVKEPTAKNNLVLADAIAAFGVKVSEHFETISGTIGLHKDVFLPFAKELLRLTGGDDSLVEVYGDFVRNMKVASAGGDRDVIESKAWASLIRDCAAFGGLYLAFDERDQIRFRSDAEKSQFFLDLMKRSESHANVILKRRGGFISLKELGRLIDTIPAIKLSDEKRAAIKADLPNIVDRVFQGRKDGALDTHAIRTVVNIFEKGMTGQIHVQRIFEDLPEEVTVSDFEDASLRYAESLERSSDRQEVDLVVSTAKLFVGLFPVDGNILHITREGQNLRTRNHLVKMHWFRTIIRHLLKVYGTGPDGSGQQSDLKLLSENFEHVLRAWKKAHPALSASEVATKRFREANLFMPNSNGDAYMSEAEGAYYLAFLFSSGSLAGNVYRTLVEGENALCPLIGRDELGEPAMSADCFRNAYFGNYEKFWRPFPGLVNSYRRMSDGARDSLQRAMESAARTTGRSDLPIGRYDVDSFAALPHYVEEVMERFDINHDQVLSKDDLFRKRVPKGAYYTFRSALREFSGVKKEWLLQCAFSYLVKYGKQPRGTLQTARLLAWCAWRPFWKISATRGDLYQVVSLISSSASSRPLTEPRSTLARSSLWDSREWNPDFYEPTVNGLGVASPDELEAIRRLLEE